MTFYEKLDSLHLLNHPFYKEWNDGQLSIQTLQTYAAEYYHHVAAFPRYISQIHALCPDIKARQVLLNNLIDEELGDDNHPELWLRFAEGIGAGRVFPTQPILKETIELVNGFFDLVQQDYATGLGALYAYERQTSSVSHSKIIGLKTHYGVNDERSLKFFTVHESADIWHTEALESLITKLSSEQQHNFENGALKGAQLLWNFLNGIHSIPHC